MNKPIDKRTDGPRDILSYRVSSAGTPLREPPDIDCTPGSRVVFEWMEHNSRTNSTVYFSGRPKAIRRNKGKF